MSLQNVSHCFKHFASYKWQMKWVVATYMSIILVSCWDSVDVLETTWENYSTCSLYSQLLPRCTKAPPISGRRRLVPTLWCMHWINLWTKCKCSMIMNDLRKRSTYFWYHMVPFLIISHNNCSIISVSRFAVSRLWKAKSELPAVDTDSCQAPGLTPDFQGSMNVHCSPL